MASVESVLSGLYNYLTDSDVIRNQVILHSSSSEVRKWDASFPLDLNHWYLYLRNERRNSGGTIFENAAVRKKTAVNLDSLKEASKQWGFAIINGCIKDNALFFSFERKGILEFVLKDAFYKKMAYGAFEFKYNISLCLADHIKDKKHISRTLAELRINLVHNVCVQFLNFVKFHADKEVPQKKILFTDVDHSNEEGIKIICGPVKARSGQNLDVNITVSMFLQQRLDDMRLIRKERYSFIKFDSPEALWKLCSSAASIDILRTCFEHPSNINLNDHYIAIPSVISFTSTWTLKLINLFGLNVEQQVYEPLPNIETIDFNLLDEPEEWELVYIYILRFPNLIKSCFEKLPVGHVKIYPLVDMLFKMTTLFTSYYNRLRYLDLPRQHTMAILHAKIFLLLAVNRVIITSLCILNIEPVT